MLSMSCPEGPSNGDVDTGEVEYSVCNNVMLGLASLGVSHELVSFTWSRVLPSCNTMMVQ